MLVSETISSFLSVLDEQTLGTVLPSDSRVNMHLLVDTFNPVNVTYILLDIYSCWFGIKLMEQSVLVTPRLLSLHEKVIFLR